MFERLAMGLSKQVAQTFRLRDWAALIVMMTASCYANLWAARLVQWPVYVRASASLVAGGRVGAGVLAVGLGMLATVTVVSLLLGWVRAEAGVFAGAVGLGALACTGGTVGALLRTGIGPRVYLSFIADAVLLLSITGLAWQAAQAIAHVVWHPHVAHDPDLEEPTTLPRRVLAALAQAVVTALLVELLAQNDGMKQVMAAAFVASLVGAVIAHQLVPIATAAPFWVGPFLVAVGGYAWAHHAPGPWAIGVPANSMARVPPLAYASLGVAGAMLGYWTSRKWREMDEEEIADDALE